MEFNDGNQWHYITNLNQYPHPLYMYRACSARSGNKYVDPQFHQQRDLVKSKVRGVIFYQFVYHNAGTAEQQAQFFCDTVGSLDYHEMVMLDIESGSDIINPVDFLRRWCSYVEPRLQTLSWIYVPHALASLITPAITQSRLIVAPKYSGSSHRGLPPTWPYDVWQYTDKGPFPGSAQGVGDCNYTILTAEEVINRSRYARTTPRRTLQLGSRGNDVRDLQKSLNTLGG